MSCIRWSPTEIRILREVYPYEGVRGVISALQSAGFPVRTPRSIQCAARYYGIQVLPDMHGAIRHGDRRRLVQPVDISPTRPVTPDSVELVHWFAGRGFPPRRIAEEINRPVEAIRKALRMRPPAIDREPWWPRRDDMIVGRAIA